MLPVIVARMERPSRVFLVEFGVPPLFTQYRLMWKAGVNTFERMQAGRSDAPVDPLIVDVGDARDEEEIIAAARSEWTPSAAWEITDSIGRHHLRIWRPEIVDGTISINESDRSTLTLDGLCLRGPLLSSVAAARIVFDELADLIRVVEPTQAQRGTYGHRLRHLLIVACTEVESCWRSVLENNRTTSATSLSTNDYVTLADPMRLREWTLGLTSSTEQLEFSPFQDWHRAHPTQTLQWYDAYNATKHGREINLHRARLDHTLDAIAALHIMLTAQFGENALEGLRSPFHIVHRPQWSPEECYHRNPFGGPLWERATLP